MTAVVKTLVPARPLNSFLATNIPFLDRNNPDEFSTRFQEDFQPFLSFKKVSSIPQPTPAQVDHKDLRHIKEQLTEAMESYPPHPLPKITRKQRWTTLYNSFKMQTDPAEVDFQTTQSQTFCPKPFHPPATLIRPLQSFKNTQQEEKPPESTNKSTFTPHQSSPVVKATAKHLEEGFPTIKGDGRYCSFVSQYNNTFHGAWSRASQPVAKHSSSVAMGDPVKIVDRNTTYTTSFSRTIVCRYRSPLVKQHLKLSLGNFCKDSWSSTSKEAFCQHKPDPVVVTRRNHNSSSLPNEDTDAMRNRERMSVTTNRISFSDLNHTERPVYAPESSLMTKSHVKFSSPSLSGQYYTTTAKEHYTKKDGDPARPANQLPSNILSGPEHGLTSSTTKSDFIPFKTRRQTPCLPQQKNIRFPLAEQQFSTTHGEHYKAKPLITASMILSRSN